jgi:hypothetical protein
MRKFAANYLVSEDGVYFKNGILVAGEDGFAIKYIDTKGDLREAEQLIFYNGILMAGYLFSKTNETSTDSESDQSFKSFVFQFVTGATKLSIQNLIDLGKQVQVQFPEMKIPEIMNKIKEVLLTNGGFTKENIPGIFLLTVVDLPELQFTSKSQLKKIL